MPLSFLLLRTVNATVNATVNVFTMKLNYSEPKIYTGGVDISTWSRLAIDPGLDYGDDTKVALEYLIDGIPVINKNKHTTDIKELDLVQLNIDLIQRGVAGNDSWGSRPEEKHLIKGDIEHAYSYFLIPLNNLNQDDLIKKSKLYSGK